MEDKLKVLVIDDEKAILDLFEFTLQFLGHTVVCAGSWEKAAEVLQTGPFDIAFLDIVMPDKDGVEILEEIKRVHPDLPVVMMSGYSVSEKRIRAVEAGAYKCLNKPFEVDHIKEVIKQATGKDV